MASKSPARYSSPSEPNRDPVTPPTCLDVQGRRRPTLACWTCGEGRADASARERPPTCRWAAPEVSMTAETDTPWLQTPTTEMGQLRRE